MGQNIVARLFGKLAGRTAADPAELDEAFGEDDLSPQDRADLDAARAQPWAELIWTVRQCDAREPFGRILFHYAYHRSLGDATVGAKEHDECRIGLAQALVSVRRHAAAIGLLQLAVEARSDSSRYFTTPLSLVLIRLADAQAAVGRTGEAAATLRRALDMQTGSQFYYDDRARAYARLAQWLDADGKDEEADTARALASAWSSLSSASNATMRGFPDQALADATAARAAIIAAAGPTHPDLRFAEREIGEARSA